MNIKDIKYFRKFYKETVRNVHASNRNENFIGHSFNNDRTEIYGFFELFHADKEDINIFITPFLDMAQDWQAVYELLQNAFDAKSKIFIIFFDENYFFAFNNGEPFSFEGIRSILNIGQSTKDSKNIGKFGVGFKIVHRLIGEGNALNEINNLNGPILFSWENLTDIQALLDVNNYDDIKNLNPEIEITKDLITTKKTFTCKDKYPWLFKILITNFPCGINEEIYNLNYELRTDLFEFKELEKLKDFANKILITNKNLSTVDYSRGSIIFLKLGKNKGTLLTQSNIKPGISCSLSILKNIKENDNEIHTHLEKIYYNNLDLPFTPANVIIEKIIIGKDEDEYGLLTSGIRAESKPDYVEYFLGFSPNASDFTIKENPTFYLYFPLSDEIHNLNFFIHCNIFHNLSQRTNLDDGEFNRKILASVSNHIIKLLNNFIQSDFNKFLSLYTAILTSDWKPLNNKSWVYDNLMKGIVEFSKMNIPVKTNKVFTKNMVRVKDTKLDIEPSEFGVDSYEWYYWNEDNLIKEALNTNKLGIKKSNIRDLIIDSTNLGLINSWLDSNKVKIEDIFDELNKLFIPNTAYEKFGNNWRLIETSLAKNISLMKLFSFSDSNYYSISEIASNTSFFILPDYSKDLKEVLISLGFHIHVFNEQKWVNLFQFLKKKFNYLSDKSKFLDYFVLGLSLVKGYLTFEQIKSLLNFFNELSAPVFEKFLIIKELNNYKLIQKTENIHQGYFKKTLIHLNNYVQEHFSKEIFRLPDELYSLVSNKTGLVEEQFIYERFNLDKATSRDRIDTVLEADSNELKKLFLDNIQLLELSEGMIYDKNTYEHKVMELVKSLDDQNFKNKIIIIPNNGISIKLSYVSFQDQIFFNNPFNKSEPKIELSLSKILPEYRETSAITENIIQSFTDFNKDQLKTIVFRIGKQKPKEEIFDEMSSTIDTPEQLAFLLLYSFEKKDSDLTKKEFFILKEEKIIALENKTYLIKSFPFVQSDRILDQRYYLIEKLLKLSTENEILKSNVCTITLNPDFEGQKFILPGSQDLDVQADATLQKQFFLSLFNIFERKASKPNYIDLCFEDLENKDPDKINNFLLGFIPQKTIFPKEYSITPEELPEYFYTWINEGDFQIKMKFLQAIRVNIEESLLVKLRKLLIDRIEFELTIKELKEIKDIYSEGLIKSLEWISYQTNEDAKFSQLSYKYGIYKNIFESLDVPEEIHLPAVVGLDQNVSLIFKVVNSSTYHKLFYITTDQLNEIKSYINVSALLSKLISDISGSTLLTSQDLISVKLSDNEKLSNVKIENRIALSRINNDFEEYKSSAYQVWRNDTYNKFKIFIGKYNISKLKYNILVNDIGIGEVEKNEIDLTEDGNIYISDKSRISELLEIIIGRYGFGQEQYDLLIEKFKNEPEEVKKLFDLEFDEFNDEQLKQIEKYNSSYFPDGETKTFKEKLLELLSFSKSPWKGYIYHFTHLENAAQIINSSKILSRNKARFKDSAGNSFISSTQNIIKDFARFYFRPHTPTQYYNEGLGKRTKNGDLPQCPVPIFFRFDINEILNKYDGICYVSNGNLRHFPETNFGNTYNFLKYFDFMNLYSRHGECDIWTYLNASQQEFIIKDGLDFSKLENYEVICKDEISKNSLVNIINNENFNINKIFVDKSMYYSENPTVKIDSRNDLTTFEISPKYFPGKLKVIEDFMLNDNVSRQVINSGKYLDIENSIASSMSAYYVNEETNLEWLVFSKTNIQNE